MNFGLFFETALICLLIYVPFLNIAFNTRPISSSHILIPATSFFMMLFFYDELRKVFVRAGIEKNPRTGLPVLNGWVVRNTYW
jgi:hypothetical protein